MIKWILSLFIFAFSLSSHAGTEYLNCPQATATNHPNFCASFKTAAACHCVESGLPNRMCQNMSTIYNLMITRFGSIYKACAYQHDTPVQVCIDDWNCYRSGGRDSQGQLCGATGSPCGN